MSFPVASYGEMFAAEGNIFQSCSSLLQNKNIKIDDLKIYLITSWEWENCFYRSF